MRFLTLTTGLALGAALGGRGAAQRPVSGPGADRRVERPPVEHRGHPAARVAAGHAVRRVRAVAIRRLGVGDQEGADGRFETLAEHWDGTRWSVLPTPDPGVSGNHLYAVDAVSPDDVWAAGQQLGAHAPDNGLVEHWDGSAWSVVPLPAATSASELLDAIAVAHGQVWVAGEADSPASGGRPLIEQYRNGAWQVASLPRSAGSDWTDLYGLAVSRDGTVWAVGTYLDKPRGDSSNALILRGRGTSWTVDRGPDPGSGGNILGGVAVIGGQVWAAGIYDNGGSELPLIERR